MGFLDTLLGNTSADAAKAAAADTYAKQQSAVGGIQQAGQQFAQNFTPWENTGANANSAVNNLINDPSSVSSLPGYQFDLGQGVKALDHSAAANGTLFSGKQGKAVTAYGQNLADNTYGSQLQRLLGVSQQGLGATGTAAQGQLGANTSAFNGQMTDAGTIGQGNIAAANAQTQGLQNLLATGASLAGTAFGGGFGGGGGIASLLKSSGPITYGSAAGPTAFS